MRTTVLVIDDAAAARLALRPLLQSGAPDNKVILVACAPKLTHRIGRFLNHASREQYRQRWARDLFAELQPMWLLAPRGAVETLIAKAPLEVVLQRMRLRAGREFVAIDARRAALARSRQRMAPGPLGLGFAPAPAD